MQNWFRTGWRFGKASCGDFCSLLGNLGSFWKGIRNVRICQWLHNTAPPCKFCGLASRATRTKERDGDPVCRDSSMIAIGPRAKRDVVHGCLIGAQGTCFWARGAFFWARGACFWARGASDRAADSRHRAADSRTAPDGRTLIAAARLHDAVDTRNPSAPPALYC